MASCLAAVAYAPPRPSDVLAWVSKTWSRHIPKMNVMQNLQWLLCIIIGIALVGMLFLSDD